MDKKLFIYSEPAKGLRVIDQNYLNNGGHDEFILVEFGGYKSRPSKFCVITYDIYGKSDSDILTEEEVVGFFGEEVLGKVKNLK